MVMIGGPWVWNFYKDWKWEFVPGVSCVQFWVWYPIIIYLYFIIIKVCVLWSQPLFTVSLSICLSSNDWVSLGNEWTSLEKNSSNFSYISFLGVNFENLTVEFYIYYGLNMHIKFHSNRILFTIWSINLFSMYNFILQKLEIITFIW